MNKCFETPYFRIDLAKEVFFLFFVPSFQEVFLENNILR